MKEVKKKKIYIVPHNTKFPRNLVLMSPCKLIGESLWSFESLLNEFLTLLQTTDSREFLPQMPYQFVH